MPLPQEREVLSKKISKIVQHNSHENYFEVSLVAVLKDIDIVII